REQTDENELYLRLDHAVAIAAKEPGCKLRKHDHQCNGADEEQRKPDVWLDENGRERDRGRHVRNERGAHEQLADLGTVQTVPYEDRVDHGKGGSRERGSGDERRLDAPVE